MTLENPAGFLLGMPASASVGDDGLGSGFAAQLGDGHAVQDGIDPAVPGGVPAVPDGLAGTLGGGRRQRGGAVEAGEAAFGKASGVADLDEELGHAADRQAADL